MFISIKFINYKSLKSRELVIVYTIYIACHCHFIFIIRSWVDAPLTHCSVSDGWCVIIPAASPYKLPLSSGTIYLFFIILYWIERFNYVKDGSSQWHYNHECPLSIACQRHYNHECPLSIACQWHYNHESIILL